MKKLGDVLLITGPAGSGKSTLAQYVASQPGWVSLSEDDIWVKRGWGSGLRSSVQEKIVQQEVVEEVMSQVKKGNSVALEFILYYLDKPNPLTDYQKALSNRGIEVRTIALKPSVEEIMERLKKRGRQNDIGNLETKRRDAEHQTSCLEAEYIEKKWIIDPKGMQVEDLFVKYIKQVSDK